MKEIFNFKKNETTGAVAYVTPEIRVYEIGIEDSILVVSGGRPPHMGYDGEEWS